MKIMKTHTSKLATIVLALGFGLTAAFVQAKLPAAAPMNDGQMAKAEEAKVKAAEAAKKEADLLTKYQDKAADNFKARTGAKPAVVAGPAAAPAPAAVAAEVKKP